MENQLFQLSDLSYEFLAFGGPIDEPSSYPELFQAIGHASACWARMEHLIDALLVHINKEAFSKAIYSDTHPVAFKAKVDLLKRWFNNHPELNAHSDDVMAVMPKIKQLADTRNLLMHGATQSFNKATGEIVLKTISPLGKGKDTFRCATEHLNVAAALTISEVTTKANLFLTALASQVFVPDALTRFRTP